MESLTTAMQALMKTDKDFSQKIKQRLILESNKVKNPYKFIAELFTQGVLCDESSDPEENFGLKEIMVQLAVTIACSKGADAIGGLMKALEVSENIQLVAALRTWAKEDFGIQSDGDLSERKGRSALKSPATKEQPIIATSPGESSSSGTKLIDQIMLRVEDDFLEQLQGHLIAKASKVANATEFCTSLVAQNVLEETDVQLAPGLEVQQQQQVDKAIKVACSKKAMGSLVVALQSSKNERILVETHDWLKTSQARKKNYPISVKSLASQPRPTTATGLFAATDKGLISLDLQTSEATALTSRHTLAVAVNHNLKKVYWSEIFTNSRIMRSNFDGSGKEVIVPQTGDAIYALAIDEASGSVYFALFFSNEIIVCNAVGENLAVVKINSSLVGETSSITLDSEKGVMYWGYCGASPQSIFRANLDGSNATMVSTGFSSLQGFTLDQLPNDVIYWLDWWEYTIGSVDVNGGNKRAVVKLEGEPRLEGIQVDARKIYFTDFNGGKIQSVDRDSGEELTTVFESTGGVHNLALLYDPVKQSM